MPEIPRLKPIHSIVARDLALGLSLVDICRNRGLNYNSWNQQTSSELFKQEVLRIQHEIEDAMIEDHVNDPTLATLRSATLSAAQRLKTEIDNLEDGKPSTRISAAQATLELTGYKKQEAKNVIVLNLSEAKLRSIQEASPLEAQPECILGTAS